jgi:HSP20 family protein
MERVFDEMGSNWREEALVSPRSAGFTPACDVEETDHHYVMSFDLPGIKKEDIRIELSNHTLRVSGERHEEHEEKGRQRTQIERSYGSFSRSFTLPETIKADQIETEYADGVLRIAVPKVESSKAQRIPIGEARPGLFQKLLGHKKEEAGKVKTSEKVA